LRQLRQFRFDINFPKTEVAVGELPAMGSSSSHWGFPAVIFRHSSNGENLAAVKVGQQTL
jgi:hypothetical protein